VLRNPPERKARKRCAQFLNIPTSENMDLGKQIFDRILQQAIWQKLKKGFLKPESAKELYVDDKENILVVKFPNSITIVGYFHFAQPLDTSEDQTKVHLQINAFILEINEIAAKNNWLPAKLYLVSSDQLSKIKGLNKDALLSTANYFYIKQGNGEPKGGALLPDDYLNKKLPYDDFLYYATNREKLKHINQITWSCSICDGNNTTGCLYHDPTECPREF